MVRSCSISLLRSATVLLISLTGCSGVGSAVAEIPAAPADSAVHSSAPRLTLLPTNGEVTSNGFLFRVTSVSLDSSRSQLLASIIVSNISSSDSQIRFNAGCPIFFRISSDSDNRTTWTSSQISCAASLGTADIPTGSSRTFSGQTPTTFQGAALKYPEIGILEVGIRYGTEPLALASGGRLSWR